MAVGSDELADRFPYLYHMAHLGSWLQIQRHGLLSTSALLDLFEICGAQRLAIESSYRENSISIRHEIHGTAVIRDQKPMPDSRLRFSHPDRGPVLRDRLLPLDWYRILNEKVFFWLTRERLNTMLCARAYRAQRHHVLVIDTEELLRRHADRVVLSPINSGNTFPYPHPRGLDTFLSMNEYPYDKWREKRRDRDPIVELAVRHSVPDVVDVVVHVEDAGYGTPSTKIWSS